MVWYDGLRWSRRHLMSSAVVAAEVAPETSVAAEVPVAAATAPEKGAATGFASLSPRFRAAAEG